MFFLVVQLNCTEHVSLLDGINNFNWNNTRSRTLLPGFEDGHVLPTNKTRRQRHPIHCGQDKASEEIKDNSSQWGGEPGGHDVFPAEQGGLSHVQWLMGRQARSRSVTINAIRWLCVSQVTCDVTVGGEHIRYRQIHDRHRHNMTNVTILKQLQ